jgi:hypothetical protein
MTVLAQEFKVLNGAGIQRRRSVLALIRFEALKFAAKLRLRW